MERVTERRSPPGHGRGGPFQTAPARSRFSTRSPRSVFGPLTTRAAERVQSAGNRLAGHQPQHAAGDPNRMGRRRGGPEATTGSPASRLRLEALVQEEIGTSAAA